MDRALQLNTYDYAARYMDPSIGRFTSIDPLAEKYYSISPYAYVANNPLKYIDLDGRKIRVAKSFIGNATTEAESIARVAATTLGSGLVNSLIRSDRTYTVTGNWFNINNFWDEDGDSNLRVNYSYDMGIVDGVDYSGDNSVLAFGHELFHAGDYDDDRYTISTKLTKSELNWLEGRAVGFQNYLSDVYGLNQTRHQYGQRLNKHASFYRFMGRNEKITNFQRTKMNK